MNTCKKIIKRFQVAKSWAICALYYNKKPKKKKIFWAVAVWFLGMFYDSEQTSRLSILS